MGQITLGEGGKSFEILPEDAIIEAKIVKVEETDHKYFKDKETGEPQHGFNFTYEFTEDTYVDPSGKEWDLTYEKNGETRRRRMWQWVTYWFAAQDNCRLYTITLAAMGIDALEPGFSFDPESLEGNPVRLVIDVDSYESNKEFDADGNPKTIYKNEVKQVLRSETGGVSQSVSRSELGEEPF